MSNSRLTQHLLRGRVGFPTALASSVGLIMASPVILTATTGFGLGGGTFAVAMLVALLLMLAQSTTFAEAACLLPTRGSVYDYLSCGLGRFFAITGTLSAYLIVHVFAGTAETMLSGTMALVNFESLNTLTEPGGGAWLVGVGMVLCFGLLNALGITAFGRAEVILTFGMWSTLMIFAVAGLLRLPAVELQGWFGASMVGDDLPTLLSLVGMAMFMFVGCEFVTPLAPEVRHASRTLPRAMALGLVGVACCMFLYGAAMRRQVENLDLGGGLHLLETPMAIPRFAEQVMGPFGRIWLGVGLLFAGAATINTLMAGLPRILYGWRWMAPCRRPSPTCTRASRHRCCASPWQRRFPACTPGGWAATAKDHPPGPGGGLRLGHRLLVTLSVVLLRIRRPDLPRAYRSPLFPLPQLFSSAGILLGMFYITPPGMNPADIYLPFALMLGLAAAYALFWTLCVQRVNPFRPLAVEEVLEKEFAEEDQQQREKAHVRLGALV